MNLIMFYGKECPHCHAMIPLVKKLEKETGIKFKKLEVWHNEENAAKMRRYADVIKPACDGALGVPTFIDLDSKKVLCGETSYYNLKLWAEKLEK